MTRLDRQRGAVLLVSLVILVLITLFVISSANLTGSDLRIVGNLQNKLATNQRVQQAIENVLSDVNNFTTAAPVPQTIVVDGTSVNVGAPVCLGTSPAQGYTAVNNITLFDTNWSITATATDTVSGATTTINQGVRIRLPSNTCP
jgi:Tfp pilus assembly protein PilX